MTENKFTLTSLVDHLNRNYHKPDGKKFTVSDVQGYIKRGYLPSYIDPSHKIEIVLVISIPGAKIYELNFIDITQTQY